MRVAGWNCEACDGHVHRDEHGGALLMSCTDECTCATCIDERRMQAEWDASEREALDESHSDEDHDDERADRARRD